MTTYFSPGVKIEEVKSGPQPIAAASSSVVAVVGTTNRGPNLDPVRITGWADFVDRFGGTVPDRFTAEAVASFFENGGAAAYIVRADPSTSSTWMARDANGDDVFSIEASSPGQWSAGLQMTITPSLDGGIGRPWTSVVESSDATAITVASAAGLRIGDAVQDPAGSSVTVQAIAGNIITVDSDPAWDDGSPVFVTQNAATINLATASGIEAGDLLVIEEPGEPASYVGVVALEEQPGGGFVVELAAATSVPGGAVAARTARYRATLNSPGLTQVNLGQLEFAGPVPVATEIADGYRAWLADGRVAEWDSDHFALADGSNLPLGAVDVQAAITVAVFNEEGIALDNPSLEDLAALYSWVPDGLSLTLTDNTNSTTATITKDGAGFVIGDPADLATVFDQVDFDPDGGTTAIVAAAFAPLVGDQVDLGGGVDVISTVSTITDNLYQIELSNTPTAGSSDEAVAFQQTRVAPYRFSLSASDGTITEAFSNLALAENHRRFYQRDGIINETSSLITVGPRLGGDPATNTEMPSQVAVSAVGSTNPAGANDLIAGIDALERSPEPAMVICPDLVSLEDPALQGAVIGAMTTHASEFRRFAIVDTPRGLDDQDLVDWRLEHVNSIYAAAYGPHLSMLNLDPDSPQQFRTVPPSGAVAGVFARTDRQRGVHKAPANEVVQGIVGLDVDYTERRQDFLNPNGVNVIRSFPGRGRRIWGARNATDDTQWRYVNVRRLFNLIENSVEQGTQWTVFEPNTPSTWLRIKGSVENFLNGLWVAGALAGGSPDEAYRVRVGLGETMTEAQVDLGHIIIQVAVAPAKPAEFVVFQFTHKQLSQ